jgi:AAA+ ATPase superfamily predicted ATPase
MARNKDILIGREGELNKLQEAFTKDHSQLVTIYGRRRVGKSTLIKHFASRHKAQFILVEGLENQPSKIQIAKFVNELYSQLKIEYIRSYQPKDWFELFDYLTSEVFARSRKKIILCLDEFQWLAASRTLLVSLIKSYWDNHWQHQNVMIILCGSTASFMINKVARSKALYGRIDLELLIEPLAPNAAAKMLTRRGADEIIKYLLIFGAIPRYLELVNQNRSFNQNVNELCFVKSGFMVDEINKIFYSQFREAAIHKRIIVALKDRPLSLQELAQKLKTSSGGGLKTSVSNLVAASFVFEIRPFGSPYKTKLVKYKLADEFLAFYFQYMEPNINIIKQNTNVKLFEKICEKNWLPWLGYSFERFCLKNSIYLAYRMGFGEEVLEFGPLYHRGEKAFQIDMIYRRADKIVVVCEIKYHSSPIDTDIIALFESKFAKFSPPRGHSIERALITWNGIDKNLQKSKYLHHHLAIKDILGPLTTQQALCES